jgi:hypothetical protein
VQDATRTLWQDKDIDRQALETGKKRTAELLKTAASLKFSFPSAGRVRLRITNLTGHKLPTGYPEGRRMWINVQFFDADGKLLAEKGKYGEKEADIFGRAVKVPTLLDPEDTTVYECLPAISEAQAKKFGKEPGPSFHFVLNDTIAIDNRIPPKGFKNSAFAEHLCGPIGAAYADGQHWDDTEWKLPAGCAKVTARLMYQSVSWEYVKFLAEENKTDEWGRRLYEAWNKTGRCPPSITAQTTRQLVAGG